MTAFDCIYSEAFLVDGLRHSRSARKSTRYLLILKGILGIILCVLAALCIRIHAYGASVTLMIFAVLLEGSRRLDERTMSRRFRKSPYYNERFRIEISENGLSTVGKNISGQTTWAVYTEARRFDDGFFSGKGRDYSVGCRAMLSSPGRPRKPTP